MSKKILERSILIRRTISRCPITSNKTLSEQKLSARNTLLNIHTYVQSLSYSRKFFSFNLISFEIDIYVCIEPSFPIKMIIAF